MCVSCGCGKYSENHGDDRHLTMEDFDQAAQAANISMDEVFKNIQKWSSEYKSASGMQSSGKSGG